MRAPDTANKTRDGQLLSQEDLQESLDFEATTPVLFHTAWALPSSISVLCG